VSFVFSLFIFLIKSVLLSAVGLGGGAFYEQLLLALGFTFPVASSFNHGYWLFCFFALPKSQNGRLSVSSDK